MKNMVSDLIYINSIIATELIKITESLVALRHGEDFLSKSSCITEHNVLNEQIMNLVEKYNKNPDEIPRKAAFENHVIKHLRKPE